MSTYQTSDPDGFVRGFESVTDALQRVEGFQHAYLLLVRDAGKAVTVGIWESEEALKASSSIVDRLRAQGAEPSDSEIVSVESYEVVHTADSYFLGFGS